ncbi:AraC family transcriptional regulator [Photobacterium nomapromontoriensis]|uniref:AraC family transcriptional regulator n=1 Tax=Photobacterium nomapromontoriensis TaxID=2910237 RepID=UPI003D0E1B60
MKHDGTVHIQQSRLLPMVELRQAKNSNACYHRHSHDEFSFGVIDSGSACYQNLGQSYAVSAGDNVTINPGDIHACNPDEGEWSYRMLFVDSLWIGLLQQELFATSGFDYHGFPHHYEQGLVYSRQFDHLYAVLQDNVDLLAAETALIEYLATIFIPNKNREAKHDTLPTTQLKQAREILCDELDVNRSVTELAEQVGLGRFQLIRSFTKQYGTSPHAFLLDEKIKRGRALLKQGTSISEASLQLGFADQSHFHRHFKKRVALTPKQFQAFFE